MFFFCLEKTNFNLRMVKTLKLIPAKVGENAWTGILSYASDENVKKI